MTISAEDYIAAMRRFPAAVNIITTGKGDARAGFTATAAMSLTAEPAQIGIAVNQSASAYPLLQANRRFSVNTLAAHHSDLARRFAGAVKGLARFDAGHWIDSGAHGPVLEDALLTLECETAQEIELSSHVLVVGDVVRVRRNEDLKPLLYVEGDWASLLPASKADQASFMGAIEASIRAIDDARAASDDFVAQLDAFVRDFTRVYIDQQEVTREYLKAELYVEPELLSDLNAAKGSFDEKLTTLLREGRDEGRFHIDDPRLTALAITGMVGWVHRWFRPDGRLGADEVARHLSRLVLQMVGAARIEAGAAPAARPGGSPG